MGIGKWRAGRLAARPTRTILLSPPPHRQPRERKAEAQGEEGGGFGDGYYSKIIHTEAKKIFWCIYTLEFQHAKRFIW